MGRCIWSKCFQYNTNIVRKSASMHIGNVNIVNFEGIKSLQHVIFFRVEDTGRKRRALNAAVERVKSSVRYRKFT